jgi:phosphatidylserine/phosphatidylglycerophosphate/cardiolipin synthase-like enzyme
MISPLQKLSAADLRALAHAVKSGRVSAPFTAMSLQRYMAPADVMVAASELERLADSGMNKESLLFAIELLSDERGKQALPDDSIDLVWTGPEADGVPSRDTSVVVREMFAMATETVLLAGYAVFQGREVFAALTNRMEEIPTLKVKMFLDVQRGRGDTTLDSEILREFAHRFKTKEWPGKRLPEVYYDPRSLEQDPYKRTSLHAKSIVVDRNCALVSSANFTHAAQNRNIEVGVLIRSTNFADQLARQFEGLAAAGMLRREMETPLTASSSKRATAAYNLFTTVGRSRTP